MELRKDLRLRLTRALSSAPPGASTLDAELPQRAADAFLAPMPGVIVKLLVEPGAAVEPGQPLLILEAMKMEHRVCAPSAGTVSSFFFTAGEQVDGGDELLEFLPAGDGP